ncbi:complement C3-like [Pristis pectinata]|uniref:complement C3-like n=1 Tax=Pristis pectinata TaxID=685728 RepID=UPI00223D5A87|nr:complement C3-like [Pristis pectinata]
MMRSWGPSNNPHQSHLPREPAPEELNTQQALGHQRSAELMSNALSTPASPPTVHRRPISAGGIHSDMGLLVIIFACLLPAVTEQKPSYLITAPHVAHVGLGQTVTLQVFESSADVTITVYFEKQVGKATEVISSRKYTAQLNQGNNFTQVIPAQILPEKTAHLNFLHEVQYATLVTELSAPFHETRKASVQLRSRPYFIYIVTDKPIYAPHETVHYQIFTLDQEMKPINCMVAVEVLDSKGTVLSTMDRQNEASSFHTGEISIESKMNGTYQIRAKVGENSEYYGLKKFRVQEYKFPRFGLQIIPDYWYYMVHNDTFPLTIQVENKMGSILNVTVMFGIHKVSGWKVPLPELNHCLQMRQGRAHLNLVTAELLRNVKKAGKLDEFIGSTFYIEAKVSDDKYTEEKVLDNLTFRLSHYNIDFASMKPYFTPGAPFYVPVSVTYPNGSPAINVSLHIEVSILKETIIKESIEGLTDQLGEVAVSFTVPLDTLYINVTARVGNAMTGFEKKQAVVKRHRSDSGRYLHIEVPHVLLFPEDIITVNLTALGLLDTDRIRYYYYMVLGKGKTLDFQRIEGRSEASFQLVITRSMVPYFRIVAYYVLQEKGMREIVSDSVRLEAESLCDTKFQVYSAVHEEGSHHQLLLSIMSDSPAKLFIQATDVQLKAFCAGDSITPRMVFEDLNSTDIGLSSGSGNNTASVFKDSGLIFFSDLMTLSPEPHIEQSEGMQGPSWRTDSGQALVTIRPKDSGPHRDNVDPVQPTFSESSMWKLDVTSVNKTFRFVTDVHPPESWEVQALSVSEENGLCLAGRLLVQTEGTRSQSKAAPTLEGATHYEETRARYRPSAGKWD